jgi:peptide/nickel transport system ATP-binding protein
MGEPLSLAPSLLEIRNVSKVYQGGFLRPGQQLVALQDFSLIVPEKPARITAIAGESGSGKTTLANLILGFIGPTSGQILYRGADISAMSPQQKLQYARQVQAVLQDPYAAYNPFYRVKHIFDLVIKNFKLAPNQPAARELIEEALKMVGMRGEEVLEKYPHQLSGGQRQRMMVARAYLLKPSLIVADEPVSMVDASLRAMILDIMLKLREQQNISFLYITHDLSTAYQVCDDIYVLYQGSIAEKGDTVRVIENPKHPYVKLLIESIPVPDPNQKWDTNVTLPSEEELRSQVDTGCRFYPRCPYHMDRCLVKQPLLYRIDSDKHQAACYLYDQTLPEDQSGVTVQQAGNKDE